MRLAQILILLTMFLLTQPASAQLVSVDRFLAIGILSAKNSCIAKYVELSSKMQAGLQILVARNQRYLTRDQWVALDQIPLFPGLTVPAREDCLKLAEELPTTDVDAAIGRAREESSCMEEVRTVTERGGATRPAIGIELVERSLEARIAQVQPSSPAAVAGIKPGDTIVEFRSQSIHSSCRLAVAVLTSKPFQEVPIVVLRGAERIQLRVTPRSVPNE